jgi:hypothetical protein
MATSSLKRDGAPLTDNEKLIIINVYNYFSEAKSIGTDHQSLLLCKRIAEVFTGQKIRYLTPILHLSVPDMCSMNAKKHTLFIYISGTYRVFLHIVHISYTYRIYMIYI